MTEDVADRIEAIERRHERGDTTHEDVRLLLIIARSWQALILADRREFGASGAAPKRGQGE